MVISLIYIFIFVIILKYLKKDISHSIHVYLIRGSASKRRGSANKRRRYIVMPSFIGWVHTENTSCLIDQSIPWSISRIAYWSSFQGKKVYFQQYYNKICTYFCIALFYTETEMSSFWLNFHRWLHWKLSKRQLPVQPAMKISSKWRDFRFSVV